MSAWISIKQHQPPIGVDVLGRFKDGHIEDMQFFVTEDGDIGHILFDGDSLALNPLHWMPLPEAPCSN